MEKQIGIKVDDSNLSWGEFIEKIEAVGLVYTG